MSIGRRRSCSGARYKIKRNKDDPRWMELPRCHSWSRPVKDGAVVQQVEESLPAETESQLDCQWNHDKYRDTETATEMRA